MYLCNLDVTKPLLSSISYSYAFYYVHQPSTQIMYVVVMCNDVTLPTKSSINCMCTNVLMQPVCSSNLVNINQVRHKNSCSSRATMKQYRLLYCTAHVSTIHSTLLSPSSKSLHVHVLTQPCCDKTSIKLTYEIYYVHQSINIQIT